PSLRALLPLSALALCASSGPTPGLGFQLELRDFGSVSGHGATISIWDGAAFTTAPLFRRLSPLKGQTFNLISRPLLRYHRERMRRSKTLSPQMYLKSSTRHPANFSMRSIESAQKCAYGLP